jgi:uncharacterized membrane protein
MTFESVVQTVIEFLTRGLVPLILTLALLMFLWGIFKYLSASGNEVKIQEGVKLMTYGIVGLFVMFAVWGLVALLIGFFDTNSVGIPQF